MMMNFSSLSQLKLFYSHYSPFFFFLFLYLLRFFVLLPSSLTLTSQRYVCVYVCVTVIIATAVPVQNVISAVIPVVVHVVINAFNAPVVGSWQAVNVIPSVLKVFISQSLAVRSVIIIVKLVMVRRRVTILHINLSIYTYICLFVCLCIYIFVFLLKALYLVHCTVICHGVCVKNIVSCMF